MKARAVIGSAPQAANRLSAPALIFLNDALASRSLVAAAEVARFLGCCERPYQRPVIDTFVAQIGATDQRTSAPEQIRELGLQSAKSGLHLSLAAL